MTRARSGSFYCPVEPSLGPLSIAQKAAISTAPSTRSPPTSSSGTFAGKRKVELLLPSVEMIASSGIVQAGSSSSRHHHRSPAVSSAGSSLPSITNSLRNVIPFQRKDKVAMSPLALGACEVVAAAAARVAAGRHMYSPARPSPLRRLVNAPEPLCPSALWTSQRELLPLYYSSQYYTPASSQYYSPSRSSSSSRGGLRRTVLKNTFLAGPMAEKAKMYGLRVAWCVFGDAKEEMARDIFTQPPAIQLPVVPPHVEQEDEGLDHVFVEHDETVDSDESSSSDSEYSDEDGDTASEESDDLELDDEEQVERDVFAIFREASFVLDKLPEVGDAAVAGDELWEVVTLQV